MLSTAGNRATHVEGRTLGFLDDAKKTLGEAAQNVKEFTADAQVEITGKVCELKNRGSQA